MGWEERPVLEWAGTTWVPLIDETTGAQVVRLVWFEPTPAAGTGADDEAV